MTTATRRQRRLSMDESPEVGRLVENEDRMTILQQWVDDLSLDERLAVSTMISKRNDPVVKLPVELIIAILDHLPIFAAWRLQLVGRRWRSLFSSEQVLRANLAQWETHDASDTGKTPSQTATESIRTKVRRTQAWRLGCAFSRLEIHDKIPPLEQHSGQIIALKGSRLAYICDSKSRGHSLIVRDLVAGSSHTIRGDAREAIHSMALGLHLVAFASHSGKLYAQDLSDLTRPARSVRLPSTAVLAMHVDRKTVGVVLEGGRSFALYSAETGSLRSFPVDFGSQPEATAISHPKLQTRIHMSLLIDSRSETVDIFRYTRTMITPQGGPRPSYNNTIKMQWEHARYSFTGHRSATSYEQVPSPKSSQPPRQINLVALPPSHCRPEPLGYDDEFTLGTIAILPVPYRDEELRLNPPPARVEHHHQILFDSKAARLRRRDHDELNEHHRIAEIHAWKDVRIYFHQHQGRHEFVTRNVVDIGSRFQSFVRHQNPHLDGSEILGFNDSFLVTMGHWDGRGTLDQQKIFLYCFDETLKCPGFVSTEIWGRDSGRLVTGEKKRVWEEYETPEPMLEVQR